MFCNDKPQGVVKVCLVKYYLEEVSVSADG